MDLSVIFDFSVAFLVFFIKSQKVELLLRDFFKYETKYFFLKLET